MHQGFLQYTIWITCTVGQLVILFAMLRRHLVHDFQLFFWYTAAHILEAVVAFTANQVSYAAYFYVYWGWELIDAALTLIVLQSVFKRVFESYDALCGMGITLFRWGTVVLCLICLLAAVYAPGKETMDRVMMAVMVMERSIQLIQVGLLLCLLLWSRVLGLAWKSHIYGIALGFGVYASLALIAVAMRAEFGFHFGKIFGWMFSSAYTVGVLIWAGYFAFVSSEEPASDGVGSHQLEQWNEALSAILRR